MTQKVLIVDDSKLARMGVTRVLKTLRPEWEIMEAADADQAFAQVRQSSPDFVLLDYNMPGKDGITLAAELREFNADIRVAVISANHQVEVVERTRAAGADFLAKPLSEKAMAGFLATVAQQRNAAGE